MSTCDQYFKMKGLFYILFSPTKSSNPMHILHSQPIEVLSSPTSGSRDCIWLVAATSDRAG